MPSKTSPLTNIKALLFDVFGTVVDWRSSVTDEISLRIFRKLSSQENPLPATLKARLEGLTQKDWDRFIQEWRDSYSAFTRSFNKDTDPWKSVDEHHHDSLVELLEKWDLEGLFTETEIESLSLVWHRLTPWPDSADGLAELGRRYATGTLSNGNTSLLRDLADFGGLSFHKIFCAETFKAYKPDPAVYLGAVRALGLQPEEVALVATHLGDLHAARACSLRTIYVERDREEAWGKEEERYIEAKNWVDLWVTEGENGLLTVAEKLGELE
ncbi:haloacid dehalogenase-like hydrolase domain-containing protein [Trichoderma breve]|uniref:Haloacid dehalogenase-like hydrolase domain-containing protein n=1 Tax=Trichoderma breve TaxID=2034170 RepID=A0A9W9BIF8_9HYPO|nr:haloacid dehalogenase-like hydrolase domain-containing protein [Trichoderma breve]KAJ4863042.1 haloacid dehalogenase-like hydrolase domain-containing protein [Trichoderma breve]